MGAISFRSSSLLLIDAAFCLFAVGDPLSPTFCGYIVAAVGILSLLVGSVEIDFSTTSFRWKLSMLDNKWKIVLAARSGLP